MWAAMHAHKYQHSTVMTADVGKVFISFRVFAVDQRHFADDLHQFGIAGFAQFFDRGDAIFAFGDAQLNFDKLVIAQSAFKFGQNALGQSIVCHNQYRFQVVANRFVLFLLLLSERHNLTPTSDLVKNMAPSLPERSVTRPDIHCSHFLILIEVPRGPFQNKPALA
ncbi:conserved protein of unknown function [Pseudomonas marincola]|uniref:Uncharacterized protein n=1 Tax=Pseudomonas marincola TaxID=437900 RepID=A0A653DZJ7_9PSED|nr:conserved protein of unknown function [Pseudomonas marincola]